MNKKYDCGKVLLSVNESCDCLTRINETLPKLSPKEKLVAQYVLKHPGKSADMTLDSLAEHSCTSISTVVRFCKTLNYNGYKEFVRSLYSDVFTLNSQSTVFEDIHPGDSTNIVKERIYSNSIAAIKNTMACLDPVELERAIEAISKAKRIDFYGAGTSGLVGMDASSKFCRIQKIAIAHTDPHTQCLLSLTEDDVAVILSYSGETADTIAVEKKIKEKGSTIISITSLGDSTVSNLADIRLHTVSTESLRRSGAMGSRMAQLYVIDVLYASVCSRVLDQIKPYLEKNQETIHPSSKNN